MHRRFSLLMACFLFSSLLLFGLTSWFAPPTRARSSAGITVDTLEDELNSDGDCSLREAITAANDNLPVDACPAGDGVLTDTITFAVSGVITVGQQLSVTAGGPLTIDGGEVITVSGNYTTRVLYVNQGSALRLMNLALVDGVADYGAGISIQGSGLAIDNSYIGGHLAAFGGGIYNQDSVLLIENSHLEGNIAGIVEIMECYGWTAGGLYNAANGNALIVNTAFTGNSSCAETGGIRNDGQMIIKNSVFSGNSGWTGSGSIENTGAMSIDRSTFLDNLGSRGGGIWNRGGLTVTNSTFSGNSGALGGGIWNQGGLTVTSSTFSGNGSWGYGGGIANGDNFGGGTLHIYNSTFYSNTVLNTGVGGGIYNFPGSEVWLYNTIVAKGLDGSNCSGVIQDGGHNLDSEDTCGFNPANGSLINTDPLLLPLQGNGGNTWTHALLAGSPAVDAGGNDTCPPTDQRGVVRPQDGDGNGVAVCDIGSYEYPEYTDYLYLPLIMNSSNGANSQSPQPAQPASSGVPFVVPSITLTLTGLMAGVRYTRQ